MWDKDILTDDFMGLATVTCPEMKSREPKTMEVKLEAKKIKQKVSGHITVIFEKH